MWCPRLLVLGACLTASGCWAASTTVIPRPPHSLHYEEAVVTASTRPERANTPSDQPKQIPPPPPPGRARFTLHTTPEYELPLPPPRQLRLLWVSEVGPTRPFIPQHTPQPSPHTAYPGRA